MALPRCGFIKAATSAMSNEYVSSYLHIYRRLYREPRAKEMKKRESLKVSKV